jgi:serine/threonine protein kinase
MLSRITGILGTFPEHVLSNGRDTGKYFTLSNIVYERDDEGSFHLIFPKKTNLRSRLHMDKPVVDLESLSEEERLQMKDEDLFVDFVGQLLHLDPEKRLTASQALKHPWLSDADEAKFTEYIIGQPATQQREPLPDDEDDDDEGESNTYLLEYSDNSLLLSLMLLLVGFEEDDNQEDDDDVGFEEEGYNEEVYINNQDDEESENADIGEIAISIEEELNNFEKSKE